MEYNALIKSVNRLDFIQTEEVADAAVKAALGIMVSRLNEEEARRLTSYLPEPLTFEKLRSHQARDLKINREEYVSEIATQFKIREDEARTLIKTVLQTTKENLPQDQVQELEDNIPDDWATLMDGK